MRKYFSIPFFLIASLLTIIIDYLKDSVFEINDIIYALVFSALGAIVYAVFLKKIF